MKPHPNALPRHADAIISKTKLRDYLLNPDHPAGTHKARLFASHLGFSRDDAAGLEAAIRRELPLQPAVERQASPFGREFSVDLPVTGPAGSATVRTAWIIETGNDVPRLVTAYVRRR